VSLAAAGRDKPHEEGDDLDDLFWAASRLYRLDSLEYFAVSLANVSRHPVSDSNAWGRVR